MEFKKIKYIERGTGEILEEKVPGESYLKSPQGYGGTPNPLQLAISDQ